MTARRVAAAVASVVLTVALAGCSTVRPEGAPVPAPAKGGFPCPTADQVGGLTATPFTLSTSGSADCVYSAGSGDERRSVTVRHPADGALPRNATLSAVRDESVLAASTRITTAQGVSVPAFTARSADGTCTTWVYAADGVVTTVAARGAKDGCATADAVAALVGSAPGATGARQTVDLVALGSGAPYPLVDAVASGSGARVRDAATIDAGASAVVLVAGSTAGTPLDVARSASAAFARATAAAPRARLLVVAPSGGDRSTRDALRAAARVAGATWIDPGAGAGTHRIVDRIVRALRADVLCARGGCASTGTG